MRTAVLIAMFLPLVGCSTTADQIVPYAMPNSLMRKEIQSRIADIEFQHGQELLNNLLWLQTKAGETAIVDLLGVLDDDNPKVRSSATWVLGRIRDRRTIPNLRPLTADKNDSVRLEAARSLVSMGDLKYVTILIEGLDSKKTPVRYNCHMALKDSTQKDFEYDHLEEDMTMRRTAVLRWREWWAKQSSDPWFAASYAREHGLPSETLEQVSAPIGETKVPGTGTETGTGIGTGTTKTSTDPRTGQPGVTGTTDPKTGENPEDEPKTKKPVFKLLDLGPKPKTDTETEETETKPKKTSTGTTRKVGPDDKGPFDVTPTPTKDSAGETTTGKAKATGENTAGEDTQKAEATEKKVGEVESPVFKLLRKNPKTGATGTGATGTGTTGAGTTGTGTTGSEKTGTGETPPKR